MELNFATIKQITATHFQRGLGFNKSQPDQIFETLICKNANYWELLIHENAVLKLEPCPI